MLPWEHTTGMDELPELLVEAIGDATVIAAVDVGGGDAIAVTPAESYLYRSEGLLSDESVDRFGHDVERFDVDVGRRKTSILFEDIDGSRSFTVPSKVASAVVEAILEGVLRTTEVIEADEAVEARFRFSDLTLVVTDSQLLKHVGSTVWDDEFETIRYEDLTGLDFEEGSVATQVVVEADGRRERVKVPNDHAGRVREEIQSAVFQYHDVSSLGGLHAKVGTVPEDEETAAEADAGDGAWGEAGGGKRDDDARDERFVTADWSPPADQDPTGPRGRVGTGTTGGTTSGGRSESTGGGRESIDDDSDDSDLAEEVRALAEQVEQQSELLETQQATLEQLVEELRRGR